MAPASAWYYVSAWDWRAARRLSGRHWPADAARRCWWRADAGRRAAVRPGAVAARCCRSRRNSGTTARYFARAWAVASAAGSGPAGPAWRRPVVRVAAVPAVRAATAADAAVAADAAREALRRCLRARRLP